jgi:hypothetical protein
MLWKMLVETTLSGAGLHGHLDESIAAPEQTLTEGTGDAANIVVNPLFAQWWTQDKKVLALILGSMVPEVACKMIRCSTAAAAWKAIHTMFGA